MNPASFVSELASIHFENVFNPYADTCAVHDKDDAAAIRRKNLRDYFKAVIANDTDTIWMGRDLGYLGGRRTGMALTDEHHLPNVPLVYAGFTPVRATYGAPVKERTATEIWALLRELRKPPLLWNVFQFHPHETEKPFSNRKFSSRELKETTEINAALISWLSIKRIVAIGGDAATYAGKFGVKVVAIRHPSYGGIADFRRGILDEYKLKARPSAMSSDQSCLFSR